VWKKIKDRHYSDGGGNAENYARRGGEEVFVSLYTAKGEVLDAKERRKGSRAIKKRGKKKNKVAHRKKKKSARTASNGGKDVPPLARKTYPWDAIKKRGWSMKLLHMGKKVGGGYTGKRKTQAN